jgi:hypothetical protein
MEIELAERNERINRVVEELLKGSNPTQIAAITGYKRADVIEYIDEWKQVVRNDHTARDRAKEAVAAADQHYALLINEAWKTAEAAEGQGQFNVKATALKLIADVESKRIGMLQQVGLLDNAELATQVADAERKQEVLVKILKEVTSTCPNCKLEVAKRLSQITGVVEAVVIEEEASGS